MINAFITYTQGALEENVSAVMVQIATVQTITLLPPAVISGFGIAMYLAEQIM